MDKNSFLIDLSESDNTDFGKRDFNAQSEPQKVFSAIWELESQVNNGGFDQYFRFSDPTIVGHAPAALGAIGATSCASIVSRALNLVSPLSANDEKRHDALDELDVHAIEQLEKLDSEFFAYPDDLTERLYAYVQANAGAFSLSTRN
jgi:hypothetical protein